MRNALTDFVDACIQLADVSKSATHMILDVWNDLSTSDSSRIVGGRIFKKETEKDFLGRVIIELDSVEKINEAWMPLQKRSKKSNISGDINISMSIAHRIDVSLFQNFFS